MDIAVLQSRFDEQQNALRSTFSPPRPPVLHCRQGVEIMFWPSPRQMSERFLASDFISHASTHTHCR